MQRGVERGLGGVLAGDLGQPRADLLEREGVVADQGGVLLDERERRLGGLVVAVDRRRLAAADVAVVMQLDLDDVLPVACLPRDHEGLGQAQPDDGGLDLHPGSLLRRGVPHHLRERVGRGSPAQGRALARGRPWDE